MPLQSGASRGIVGKNIREMVASGHPQRQAVAAALSNADRHSRAATGGGIVGRYAEGGATPDYFARNSKWVSPSASRSYNTSLSPENEGKFRDWVKSNNVPFQANEPVTDYDMRGFWSALQSGDPRATSAIDPNDQRLHYPDYWKTPYHETFSAESQWATPDAPKWSNDDKLISNDGTVLFDDRAAPPVSGNRRGGIVGYYGGGGIASSLGRYEAGGAPMSFGQDASMAHHTAQATTTGFLHSAVPGRTDLIHAAPPVGSYVLPADIVSGIGQGNSMAGAHILQQALSVGPFGTTLPGKRTGGVGIPAPPRPFTEPLMGPKAKRGGRQGEEHVGQPTPILAAGGEFIIDPETVRSWGHGDMKRGHDILDEWVVRKRKEIAHEILSLKGPKKR